ncbi:MAG TPA: hypothetical protein VK607_26265 [Kofleriaceae bacterium]|nr:hypothetical protein [Kofleriaceae bacterium]
MLLTVSRVLLLGLGLGLGLPLALAACGASEAAADPFDTLQDCYDDHHNVEKLTVQQAIVVCCLDHPIAGVHPSCTSTQAECMTHVRAELEATVLDADITAACTTYLSQK